MICKLVHTGKTGEDELLGYKAINVICLNGEPFRFCEGKTSLSVGLLVDCMVLTSSGKEISATNHWSAIESDIRNGYLKPEAK
jgi:hypothetical protein